MNNKHYLGSHKKKNLIYFHIWMATRRWEVGSMTIVNTVSDLEMTFKTWEAKKHWVKISVICGEGRRLFNIKVTSAFLEISITKSTIPDISKKWSAFFLCFQYFVNVRTRIILWLLTLEVKLGVRIKCCKLFQRSKTTFMSSCYCHVSWDTL